jgi:hypothetical protein
MSLLISFSGKQRLVKTEGMISLGEKAFSYHGVEPLSYVESLPGLRDDRLSHLSVLRCRETCAMLQTWPFAFFSCFSRFSNSVLLTQAHSYFCSQCERS